MVKQPNKLLREALSNSPSGIQQRFNGLGADRSTPWHVEEQFRLVVESAKDYAIILLDEQGKIVSWNQGAERTKGYKADEIMGRYFSCFYISEDREDGIPEKVLLRAARVGQFELEGWRIRHDGSRFWANVIVTALYGPKGRLLGFSKITRDLTDRMQKERALRASQQSLRHLSNQLLHAQDEERQRIGRNLHDGVGQRLVMLKMYLASLRSGRPSMETFQEKLSACIRLAEEAMLEIRSASYELCPPMLEECGLRSAIPWFLDGFTERSAVRTTYDIRGIDRLPYNEEIAIFRVVQECLANARRHSGSPSVDILLHKKDSTLSLKVKDQGGGIPQDVLEAFNHDSPGKLGVGLRSIKERIHQPGGDLKVVSNKRGTTITASVPVEKPPQNANEPH